jgi:hypothetical protein
VCMWNSGCVQCRWADQIDKPHKAAIPHEWLPKQTESDKSEVLFLLQAQKDLAEKLKEDVVTMRTRYMTLTDKISLTNTKIMDMTRELAAAAVDSTGKIIM